jgi:hypothetical protein
LFADLDSQISLAFLTRFDCQDRADRLSVKRLAAWLAGVGYSGRTDPSVLYPGVATSLPGFVDSPRRRCVAPNRCRHDHLAERDGTDPTEGLFWHDRRPRPEHYLPTTRPYGARPRPRVALLR